MGGSGRGGWQAGEVGGMGHRVEYHNREEVREGWVLEKKSGTSRRGSRYLHRPSWKVQWGPASGLLGWVGLGAAGRPRQGSRSIQGIMADTEANWNPYPPFQIWEQAAQTRDNLLRSTVRGGKSQSLDPPGLASPSTPWANLEFSLFPWLMLPMSHVEVTWGED